MPRWRLGNLECSKARKLAQEAYYSIAYVTGPDQPHPPHRNRFGGQKAGTWSADRPHAAARRTAASGLMQSSTGAVPAESFSRCHHGFLAPSVRNLWCSTIQLLQPDMATLNQADSGHDVDMRRIIQVNWRRLTNFLVFKGSL